MNDERLFDYFSYKYEDLDNTFANNEL